MRYVMLGLMILCIAVVPVSARKLVYKIPLELIEETRDRMTQVRDNPHSADAHFNLAMTYGYTGKILDGWDELKKVNEIDEEYAQKVVDRYRVKIEQDPQNWRHYFTIAFGYYFLKDKEKAQASFQKAVDLDPKNVWAMGFLAYMHIENDRYQTALDICNRAIEMEPYATGVYFVKAWAQSKLGDMTGATATFMRYQRMASYDKILQPKIKPHPKK